MSYTRIIEKNSHVRDAGFGGVRRGYLRATEKNRRKIQQAFAELLAERGSIKGITVTDLALAAGITRGTFYNYYDNLHEVGMELQDEVERQIFAGEEVLGDLEGVLKYIDELFGFLKGQEGMYRELLASDAPMDYLRQLENNMGERVVSALRKIGVEDKNAEMELICTVNGAIAMVRKYYRGEVESSLEEIRDYLKAKIEWLFGMVTVGAEVGGGVVEVEPALGETGLAEIDIPLTEEFGEFALV